MGGLKAQITQLKQVAMSGQVSAANPFQNALGVPTQIDTIKTRVNFVACGDWHSYASIKL